MFIFAFIYVLSVLPESFPEEKRNALSRMRTDSSIHPTTRLASFFHIFEPLKMLVPTRTLGGARNWRLTWCAVHTFVFMTANHYAPTAWLVLATSIYHLTPADVSTSTNRTLYKLIFFALDWYFLHHRHCQWHDRPGCDRSTARSFFASILQPKNHTFPRGRRRQQQ